MGLTGRFQYQISDRVGLRYEGNVTRLDLDRFRAHALGHQALKIGRGASSEYFTTRLFSLR
jgi:hypothetical protein